MIENNRKTEITLINYCALHRRFLPFMEVTVGRRRIYDSDDPAERARLAKQAYEKTQKAKARKRKYLNKPEVKQQIRKKFREWYKERKQRSQV